MKKTTIMKYTLMVVCTIGIAVIIALDVKVHTVAAQAENNEPVLEQKTGSNDRTETEKPVRRRRRKGGPLMRVLDVDKDGVLSAKEIENAGAALKALDANGDGNVTRDELHQKKDRQGRDDKSRVEKQD